MGEKSPSPLSTIEKIGNYLRDVQYKSLMVNSANFNVRLMRGRRSRVPFFDSQTGIAQNSSQLHMNALQRMPGQEDGQIYVYPTKRWCRRKRSYLAIAEQAARDAEVSEHPTISVPESLTIAPDESNTSFETRDSFYYEDPTAFLEEEDEDLLDDEELDDTYSTRTGRGKAKKKSGPRSKGSPKPATSNGGTGVGVAGKKKKKSAIGNRTSETAEDGAQGKPYECQLCGARYKTRQGLSYHLSHTHKGNKAKKGAEPPMPPSSGYPSQGYQAPEFHEFQPDGYPGMGTGHPGLGPVHTGMETGHPNMGSGHPALGSGHTHTTVMSSMSGNSSGGRLLLTEPPRGSFAPQPAAENPMGFSGVDFHEHSFSDIAEQLRRMDGPPSLPPPPMNPMPKMPAEKPRASANSYCDFCLGDSSLNKKSGVSEELVSCADCGRSGHPTCLQFNQYMMVSVRQYRWQCIECKCCTLCGTSENDDQMMFCDDCDRGYHLYCLNPPMKEPPEGEWACDLCLRQFHGK